MLHRPIVTAKLYLEDAYRRKAQARVIACRDGWCALSQTLFHAGGGGQPPDRGELVLGEEQLAVTDVRVEDDGHTWHRVGRDVTVGAALSLHLDWDFRYALMRHHALMHVVNTIARDHFGGVITGVQLGPEQSRIDFKLTGFSRDQLPIFESLVNAVTERACEVTSSTITEAEFHSRPELIRTLNVLPPIVDGRVRVVTIAGFDAQACGGTHVHSTEEIGHARMERFDNKGKDNKRFYWRLGA